MTVSRLVVTQVAINTTKKVPMSNPKFGACVSRIFTLRT